MFARPACRACLHQSIPRITQHIPRRHQSDFSNLHAELTARKLPILYDDLSPRNSHNLNVSLANYIPDSWLPKSTFEDGLPLPNASAQLPASHHLVYFNPALPPSKLLSDGTDPNQSPNEPFVRRMWAGGNVRWKNAMKLDGKRWACVEGIRDVIVKGRPGEEKVFVGIERRFGSTEGSSGDTQVREKLWADHEDDFAGADVIERRNIVFMRERTPEELAKVRGQGAAPPKEKMLKRESLFLNPPAVVHPLIIDSAKHALIHPHPNSNRDPPLPLQCPYLQCSRYPPRSTILPRHRRPP